MADMGDRLQDDDFVADALRDQQTMENERAPWESVYRDIDRRVNPTGAGRFLSSSPGTLRGLDNFDSTAIEGLGRWSAIIAGISIPRVPRWHGLEFADKDLNKLPAVKAWCEHATDRLFGMRYAPLTGFGTQANADIRQLGSYGTAPMWIHEVPGQHLFYKALHLSEVYIDENFAGRVDKVHRKFTQSARQCEQQFGENGSLSPKMAKAIADRKLDEQFEILHVVRPNKSRDRGRLDWRRFPIESGYIAIDEKWTLQRGGFNTMPIAVSRQFTSPGEKYGRSPAINVIGTIKSVNEMAKTLLRAAHKAVDPALAFYDDGDISKLVTRPGGMNPGLIGDQGQMLVRPIEQGGDLPFGEAKVVSEREVIQRAFLEEMFNLLTNPADRMTATQVLETLQKEGILVRPFADQYESEKSSMIVTRELDIGMRARQIDPFPPEVLEAGAFPSAHMTNPLSRMARAEEAAGFARWSEMLIGLAQFDEEVIDMVEVDEAARGTAEVLGVRPSWVASPERVAEKRRRRADDKALAQLSATAPDAAAAALDLAKANQIASAA